MNIKTYNHICRVLNTVRKIMKLVTNPDRYDSSRDI